MAAIGMPKKGLANDLYRVLFVTSRPCVICNEPIVEGQRFYQRDAWRILGHMGCVLAEPDKWDVLPDA